MDKFYVPEGSLQNTAENKLRLSSFSSIEHAIAEETILEAPVTMCDGEFNLIADLGICRGIISRKEAALTQGGITAKDIAIITRVGKSTCFVPQGFTDISGERVCVLSRRRAQEKCNEEYISKLETGDIIEGRITHFEPFGAFVDIGCGIISLMSIDSISVSRISHPRDRFHIGQYIKCAVKSRETQGEYSGRISLTHKELLGTWEENAGMFEVGQTVAGTVRSIESYGIFVELTPNLAGLSEYKAGVQAGQSAAVYIKNIIPEKKKIKLVLIDASPGEARRTKIKYFICDGNVSGWKY